MQTPADDLPPARDGDAPDAGTRRRRVRFGAAAAALLIVAAVLVVVLPTHPHRGGAGGVDSSESGYAASVPLPACGASCDPIDPHYLTDVGFGRVSFWVQPWRAYLDTWPATRLGDALGINFNVKPAQAWAVARVLHASGFRLARLELGWDSLSYSHPSSFVHAASIETRLRALRANALRPLFVLNANSGFPCPGRAIDLELAAPAAAGAATILLTPASAAQVVPGRSGFNPGVFGKGRRRRPHHRARAGASPRLTPAQRRARRAANRAARRVRNKAGLTALVLGGTPGILITKVSPGGVATLSRPLPIALAAGTHHGTALLYAPFASPKLADGSPNPAFQETLHGWLAYVGTVAREAQRVFGPGGYDLEIWNELTFGSEFLNVGNYYARAPGAASRRAMRKVTREVVKAVLDETIAYMRDPRNGFSPAVGISDGFASETPFAGGGLAPKGLTAISKHPYVGAIDYPYDYRKGSIRPINALGAPDTRARRSFKPLFIPSYQSLFPEYTLAVTSTETLIRDLAPITTRVSRAPHGRFASRPDQRPTEKWITEYNLGSSATPVGPDEVTPQSSVSLSPADRSHFHTKALLRSLVAMVGKGVSREYFFAAAKGPFSLIGEDFFSALESHPGSYPGDMLAGEILTSFHNMLTRFQGPGPGPAARQLKLLSITQDGSHAQFSGDGTSAHPSLLDREVLAVLPFQSSPTHFVIPVYVMTRDLLTLYRPAAPARERTRFDLPDETFHITLGNLPETAAAPILSAYDPITNKTTTARLSSRSGNTATIEIAATDYPRLLNVEYPEHA